MRFFKSTICFILIFSCGVSIGFSESYKKQASYKQAVAIAATIDDLIRATRQQYIRIVVQKLEKEGTGSTFHYNKKGFVPLPIQFIRSISNVKLKKSVHLPEYQFELRSYWNINQTQGLQDSFDKKGWEYLLKQQKKHKDSGRSLRYLNWRPYIDVALTNKGKVLRYFSPDIASSLSCINCHNKLEATDKIKKYRIKNGTTALKEFELYELLGAISIKVKIND